MTPREKQIFEKDIQRHLDEMDGEDKYSHLSGEEAYELAVEKAEAAYDDYCNTKFEERREEKWND